MKGIKLGILAICVALAGLCAATNHFYAYIGGGLAVVLALYNGPQKLDHHFEINREHGKIKSTK